jgi:NAD(P)-dependent dehydrogenase (short-subunit alcohol dehydrogenase family)
MLPIPVLPCLPGARPVALAACVLLLALPVTLARTATALQEAAPAAAPAPAAGERTLLVTGANRGLGLEFARQYHAAGWTVIGTAREPDAATELKALGVRVEALDVASGESVAALAQRLKGVPIDLLINNAGVSSMGRKPLQELDLAEYERVLQVNAIGPVRVTQALLPNLRAGTGRKVVSISSSLGSITDNTGGGFWAYRESKAALDMFMRSLAAELKPEGFICIAMSPGWVKTDMGGPDADLTPEQSIAGMRRVIDGLKPEDTGRFFRHDGATVAW